MAILAQALLVPRWPWRCRLAGAMAPASLWRFAGALGKLWRLSSSSLPPCIRSLHADLLLATRAELLPHHAGGSEQQDLFDFLARLAGGPLAESQGKSALQGITSQSDGACAAAPTTPAPLVRDPWPATPPQVQRSASPQPSVPTSGLGKRVRFAGVEASSGIRMNLNKAKKRHARDRNIKRCLWVRSQGTQVHACWDAPPPSAPSVFWTMAQAWQFEVQGLHSTCWHRRLGICDFSDAFCPIWSVSFGGGDSFMLDACNDAHRAACASFYGVSDGDDDVAQPAAPLSAGTQDPRRPDSVGPPAGLSLAQHELLWLEGFIEHLDCIDMYEVFEAFAERFGALDDARKDTIGVAVTAFLDANDRSSCASAQSATG